MADLNLRQQGSEIYGNVQEGDILPLFIRFSQKDVEYHEEVLKSSVPFNDIVAQVSGVHQCSFIHRKQKNKSKTYDEVAIKIGEIPFCLTAQRANDGFSLRSPHFESKNMVLPDEKEMYITKECQVIFVDFYEDTFRMFRNCGSYWINNSDKIDQFINDCFKLPVPPIEIRIEEDREMWKAYLEGLNALLASKRDLIRIQSIIKQKNQLRINFDMNSYVENLRSAIIEEFNGKCDVEPEISVTDGTCTIAFDQYQFITEDTIENIKIIGREYCFKAEGEPVNIVSGKISLLSSPEELAAITSDIDKELSDFGVDYIKTESGEYSLSTDKDVEFLRKIVDTRHDGIAEVINTSALVVPLSPSSGGFNTEAVYNYLPEEATVQSHGNYVIISTKRPLDTHSELFNILKFVSCKVSVFPQEIDTSKSIEGATIKGNAYTNIINDASELKNLGKLFKAVTAQYDQYITSVYQYALLPQIDRAILQDLKMQYYGSPSIRVDVPRACIILHPKTKQDYDTLKETVTSQLPSEISASFPSYSIKAKVCFLCENEQYRKDVFERVNMALLENKSTFSRSKVSKDSKEMSFEFKFDNIEERDNVEKIISDALSAIHGVRVIYDDGNSRGETIWTMSEDVSMLQEMDRKLQSDFRNETVNFINGRQYDALQNLDEDELANSQYSPERIIKFKQIGYLQKNSISVGSCSRRARDYAIIDLYPEIKEQISSQELKINKGDYIQFPSIGEAMELKRQSRAMNRILKPESKFNHRPINQNLPNFIFDPKYANETMADISLAMEDIRAHKIGNLNEKQLEAVAKSVLATDLALIQGPPGTGKTTVIAEIIWQEIRKNPDCRILLTSQTNLAVDNALERLQGCAGIRPVRIGKVDKLEPEGRRFSLSTIDSWAQNISESEDNAARIWVDRIANKVSNDPRYSSAVSAWKSELATKDKHSRTEFCSLYKKNVNLVAATCSICGSSIFMESYNDMFGGNEHSDMFYDIVIMDEASKATPLEMAVPLVLGKKIIVIGDHKQLPPMMDEDTIDTALEKMGRKDLAEKLQKAESQFKRLFESAAKVRKTIVATLDTQYRMHEQIMNTIKQFYEEELAATGGLKCGITDTMDIPDLTNKGSRWHGITLDPILQPGTHALWIDVNTPETYLSPGYKNEGELKAVDLVLKALQQADGYHRFMESQTRPEDKELGIITFYSAQSRELKKRYKGMNYRMDVVDRFQGMERNIVIVSTVRSNPKNNIGFAKEIERINVAFSRARRLLIVVGNKHQFELNSNYQASIANMDTISYEQLSAAVR